MEHRPHHSRDHDHQSHHRPDGQSHHRALDLDAQVFGDQLGAVLDLTGLSDARILVDLGAGTGAGSRMLRERFPDAALTCIDNDPQMLERLRDQGFAVRDADLDQGFPTPAGSSGTADAPGGARVDLVWASSSLHHVVDPGRLLSGIRQALAPGGVLVVVELAALPLFLGGPGRRQSSEALLEQRCHAAAAAAGWNHYPDWTPVIEAAGFGVTKSEVTTVAPLTPAVCEYAQEWFGRFLHLAALTTDDRHAVEDLLERLPDDLELDSRATRTVWVATNSHQRTRSKLEVDPDAVQWDRQ